MFRYQDGNNYYRFSWDSEQVYRRLVKRQAGAFSLLAEDAVPYVPGRVYRVGIVADGAVLEVWIEGMRIFTVTDTSFPEGSIALYSRNNWGSYFDDIVVTAQPDSFTLVRPPNARNSHIVGHASDHARRQAQTAPQPIP